jgi:hypothetical protein
MLNLLKKLSTPQEIFTNSIHTARLLKNVVTATPCPSCQQLTLTLQQITHGPKGYEVDVTCTNCHFNGTVNSHGYQLKQINSKGKAVT